MRIGYFGPSDPAHPDGGDLWVAAQMAIDEANRQGGVRGKPFRLVPGWSDQPWKSGVNLVTRMVYVEGVWAIVGGIDGPSTHLAEQITTKARLPLISPVSTDRTANSAFVPWIFSCLPGDDVLAPLVADQLARDTHARPFAIIAADDHDSRQFLAELTRALSRRKLTPSGQFVFATVPGDPAPVVTRTVQATPQAVVVVAGPLASALLVKGLREAGYTGAIYGGPWMGRRLFIEKAGNAAEGVVFPMLYVPAEPDTRFAAEFLRRSGKSPDYAAAATYDAVTLLVAAVRKAGLNRARIGDALRELSPWKGVAGPIQWDALGGNARPAALATLRASRVVPLSATTP